MFHGVGTGSPALCCWRSYENGTRPLCISWVAGRGCRSFRVSAFFGWDAWLDNCFRVIVFLQLGPGLGLI